MLGICELEDWGSGFRVWGYNVCGYMPTMENQLEQRVEHGRNMHGFYDLGFRPGY